MPNCESSVFFSSKRHFLKLILFFALIFLRLFLCNPFFFKLI